MLQVRENKISLRIRAVAHLTGNIAARRSVYSWLRTMPSEGVWCGLRHLLKAQKTVSRG